MKSSLNMWRVSIAAGLCEFRGSPEPGPQRNKLITFLGHRKFLLLIKLQGLVNGDVGSIAVSGIPGYYSLSIE